MLFTSQLSRSLCFRGTVLLFANYYATITILRAITPAFGHLAAVDARLEGKYRAGMGRIGREAEEIAYIICLDLHTHNLTYTSRFYNGGVWEKDFLTKAYLKLIRHINSIYKVCLIFYC